MSDLINSLAGIASLSIKHGDHNVPKHLITWYLEQKRPQGFFMDTVTLPEGEPSLPNNLYGPLCGDEPVSGEVMIRDANDAYRQATPFVNLPPRPSRLLTIIGMVSDKGTQIFTAYGGPRAERIPSDPSLANDAEARAAAEKFWSEHALSIAAKK